MNDMIVAFLGGGSFVASLEFIKWLWGKIEDKLRGKKKDKITNVFKIVHTIYAIINRTLTNTGARRVLVFKASNGGKIPAVGTPLYSSVVYEVYDDQVGTIKEQWQDQLLDDFYLNLLLELDEKEKKFITIDELEPGSFLRSAYAVNKVDASYLVKLNVDKGVFHYMSISFDDRDDVDMNVLEYEARIARSVISGMLKTYGSNEIDRKD